MATKQAERIQGFIGLVSRVSWLIDDWGTLNWNRSNSSRQS